MSKGMLVQASRIIGTGTVVYTAWEQIEGGALSAHGFSTITYLNGKLHGKIGTRIDVAALAHLAVGSDERSLAVKAAYEAEYARAYAVIIEARPFAADGKASSGQIECTVEVEQGGRQCEMCFGSQASHTCGCYGVVTFSDVVGGHLHIGDFFIPGENRSLAVDGEAEFVHPKDRVAQVVFKCEHMVVTLIGNDETGLRSATCDVCGADLGRRVVNGEYVYYALETGESGSRFPVGVK